MNHILHQFPWYAPTPGTLYKWLATRKRPLRGINFQAPGLLDTAGFGTDASLFSTAVLLEIVGLIAFYLFFESILFAVLFFVLDFVFAIGSHWNRGRLTELKNQLILIRDFTFGEEKDSDSGGNLKPVAARIRWRKQAIFRFNMVAGFFFTLIWAIAAFKVAGFINGWLESGNDFGVIPILIAVTYALVAFIHVYATGYFFAELNVRRLARQETRVHRLTLMNSINAVNPYHHQNIYLRPGLEFTFPDPPVHVPPLLPRAHIHCDNHLLQFNTLSTFGVLTDDQVRQIGAQIVEPHGAELYEKKDTFFRFALYHQLTTILANNPVRNPPPAPTTVPLPAAPVFPLPEGPTLMNDDETYPWFMPGVETKKIWLSTRKAGYQLGHFHAPGFFGTSRFQVDTFLFSLALLLEAVGLVAFYSFFGSILFAALFFVLDFIFAIGSHWNKGRWTQLKNQLVLISTPNVSPFEFPEPGDYNTAGILLPDPARMAWRRSKLTWFNLYSAIFYFFICAIAAFKAYGFIEGWTQAGQPFGVIPLLIAITYALVAFIHIYATGYFFAETYFKLRYNQERKSHMLTHAFKVPSVPGYLASTIQLPPGLVMNQTIAHGGHYLVNNVLYTFGMFTDHHISNISLGITVPLATDYFLKHALYHQITNVIGQSPETGLPAPFGQRPLPPPLAAVDPGVPVPGLND